MATSLPVEDTAKRLQRALETLARSVDQASSGAVDKFTDSMVDLIKTSALLSKADSSRIKDLQSVNTALVKLRDNAKNYKAVQDKLSKGSLSFNEALKEYTANFTKANKATAKQTIKNAADLKDAIDLEIKAHAALADEIGQTTKQLQTTGARFDKIVDDHKSRLVKSISELATFSYSAKQAGEAFTVLYKTGVKLANRGLLSTMGQMATSALDLRMSTEEFIDLIDKNRDTVMAFGGGAKGILEFNNAIDSAAVGLEYMGKDGFKASAQFIATFNRAGVTAEAYTDNAKQVNTQYKKFNAVFGTTSDEFADYYDTVFQSNQLQAQLNLGDTKSAALLTKEIIARTDNLTALGLSTKQLSEMSKTIESIQDPRKNRQAEAIKENAYSHLAMQSAARYLREQGDDEGADQIEKGEAQQDTWLHDSKDNKKDLVKYKDLAIAKAKADAVNASAQNGDETSFNAFGLRDFSEKSGESSKFLIKAGHEIINAHLGKRDDKMGQVNAMDGAGLNANGENKNSTKAFGAVRKAVEQTSSILNSDFAPALKSLAAFIGAVIGPEALIAGGSAAASGGGGFLSSMLGSAAGSAIGGGAMAGLATAALPILGSIALAALAIAAGGVITYLTAKAADALGGGAALFDATHKDEIDGSTILSRTAKGVVNLFSGSGSPKGPGSGSSQSPSSLGSSSISSMPAATKRPNVDMDNIDPSMRDNLAAMAQEYYEKTGKKLTFNSGFRSNEQQAALYASGNGGVPVARPGSSLHNYGGAVDIQQAPELDQMGLLKKYGLERPISGDPVHVQPIGATLGSARAAFENNQTNKTSQIDKSPVMPDATSIAPTATADSISPLPAAINAQNEIGKTGNSILAQILNVVSRTDGRDQAKPNKRTLVAQGTW